MDPETLVTIDTLFTHDTYKTFDSMAKRRQGEGSSEGYLCGVEISRRLRPSQTAHHWTAQCGHGRLRVGWAILADFGRVPMISYTLHRQQRVRVPVEGGVQSLTLG